MIVAFSGSRELTNPINNHLVHNLIKQFAAELPNLWGTSAPYMKWEGITEIVHGDGQGFDQCVEAYAKIVGCPTRKFPANWKKYGKKAGPMRNKAMIKEAHALIAVPYGKSPGTRGTIRLAQAERIPLLIHEVAMVKNGIAV